MKTMTGPDPNKPIDETLLDPGLRLRRIIGTAEQMKAVPTVPLKRYYKSLLEIEKMANNYIDDRNLERAFVLFYRFTWFAISELKSHPDYEIHDSNEKRQVIASLNKNMEIAERIKNEIRPVYQLQAEYYRFEDEQRKLRLSNFEKWLASREEAAKESARLLKIAEAATHRIGLVMGYVMPLQAEPDDNHPKNVPPRTEPAGKAASSSATATSSLQASEAQPGEIEVLGTSSAKRPPIVQSPPMIPGTSAVSAFRPVAVKRPEEFTYASEYPGLDGSTDEPVVKKGAPPPPPINRDTKPTEGIGKSMAIPSDLVQKFLIASSGNTEANVETCGILGGSLLRDRFVITHVVIPKQSGTSDGCSCDDDVQIATALSKLSLLSLGWIHTHPSQTAFLSSIDLHTHYGHQRMISEAIAIVAAPSQNQVGTFTLTPQGMTTIENCDKRGFHPHPEAVGQLFTNADHVHYTEHLSATVLDYRKE